MKQGKRFGLSAEQKSDVWRRRKSGQTLHEIGRAFGKEHSSIRCLVRVTVGLLRQYGGVRSSRSRCGSARKSLGGWLPVRRTVRLPNVLERAVSTVSREVARHGGRPAYRASQADGEAWQSALRPKRCLLSLNLKLRNPLE